jgi:hypothetical protein
MHNNKLWLAALIFALLVPTGSWAEEYCVPGGQSVTEEDMLHPPPDMLAFRAEILKILPHGHINFKPHNGFSVHYKIQKMFQGQVNGNSIWLEYGGCQSVPGQAGDTILVLAMKDSNVDWFAPEFWKRSR